MGSPPRTWQGETGNNFLSRCLARTGTFKPKNQQTGCVRVAESAVPEERLDPPESRQPLWSWLGAWAGAGAGGIHSRGQVRLPRAPAGAWSGKGHQSRQRWISFAILGRCQKVLHSSPGQCLTLATVSGCFSLKDILR